MRLRMAFLALVALLVGVPTEASAQAPDCSYSSCALRVRFGVLGGQTLVRAATGEKVRGVGFPVSNLDEAFAGSPTAQSLARTYRTRTNLGSVLVFAGAVSLVAWAVKEIDTIGDADGTLLWVAVPLTLIGGITTGSGRDYLSRAVWEYNRSLVR